MAVKQSSFRVGKVRGDLRGKVWYLTYSEDGRRRRPRVGSDKDAAKQMAAQIHSQLEVGAPAALSFEAVSLDELQDRWLRHHEQVLRSSVQTINFSLCPFPLSFAFPFFFFPSGASDR